jgi:hypothetical protein
MNKIVSYFATAIFSGIVLTPSALYADCPEGSRNTTAAEQQNFMNTMNAIKAAIPPAPAGWDLQVPNTPYTTGPSTVCQGSKLVAGYDATYTSAERLKQNQERQKQRDARVQALQQLPSDKQKEADALSKEGSTLGYKSIAALKEKNADEAARLREEANKKYAESRAIKQAHLQEIGPKITEIMNADQAAYLNPEVKAHIVVLDSANSPSKGEVVQIPGVSSAFFDREKTLTLSFGRDSFGGVIWVQLHGDREPVMAVANLFASSSLRTLAAK